ncbi:MAG: PEP-CTERM sorting domain-containing protein [Bryobacteraceae bacterium]
MSATVNITAGGVVPEPSTFVLLGLGLVFGAAIRRRV